MSFRTHRVDFMTAHVYGWPKASYLLRKLTELHERYGRPVWLTEFSVADWNATTKRNNRYTTDQVEDFMWEAVAGMRELDFVERFAWKTRTVNDPHMWISAFYQNDGTLTSRGRLYASL